MIIVKGRCFEITELTEITPILFHFDGTYFYVCSGIVENELRVMKNWSTVHIPRPDIACWLVTLEQGVQIPQELGDYLVAHQDNNQTTDETEQTEDQPED